MTVAATFGDAIAAMDKVAMLQVAFALYVIDLHIPEGKAPEELMRHVRKLKIAPTNRGQAFVRYLRDRVGEDVKFMYFTAIPTALDRSPPEFFQKGDDSFVVPKFHSEDEIVQRIKARLVAV